MKVLNTKGETAERERERERRYKARKHLGRDR